MFADNMSHKNSLCKAFKCLFVTKLLSLLLISERLTDTNVIHTIPYPMDYIINPLDLRFISTTTVLPLSSKQLLTLEMIACELTPIQRLHLKQFE